MNRTRSSLNKKPRQPTTRITRSASSQSKGKDPEPSLFAKQRKKQSDWGLTKELSQMSVDGQDELSDGNRLSQGSVLKGGCEAKSRSGGGLASVVRLLKLGRCKNVVVVAGAGISTASGIPDFRTPGTGLYANLEKYSIPYPEAIFNIDYFSNDPQPFFSLAKELYPGSHRPNYVHYFLRMLHHKGLLLRLYTQNIDGLEKLCGIPEDKLVEAHGSFATASCHLCYTPYPADEAKLSIMNDKVPVCGFCSATVKPDVVFFGEDLPQKYFLNTVDFPKTDLLIIMGTSLQIEPFASLVNTVRSTVPRLLLNRDAVGPFQKSPLRRGDYMELGDLETTVRRFADLLSCNTEIEELMMRAEANLPPLVSIAPPVPEGSDHPMMSEFSGGEDTDSETDSKSSASSHLSH
ncbi:NAD-dependent protein deacetylase sirtuin-3 [Synchiropus splendidus]|uniref:NAD-dependent protein deacetylase sirtuin-3 n=1 Tax=Synchiropus splendidus TaxID=270530 RepID=UPI00237D5262|nr:NAD-dependent protein deacetylase sirtuin-3 [Synchiropus splendidus]